MNTRLAALILCAIVLGGGARTATAQGVASTPARPVLPLVLAGQSNAVFMHDALLNAYRPGV